MSKPDAVGALIAACDDVYEFDRADYKPDAAARRDAIAEALREVVEAQRELLERCEKFPRELPLLQHIARNKAALARLDEVAK